jgi:hAT family C-terminal dimerisation region
MECESTEVTSRVQKKSRVKIFWKKIISEKYREATSRTGANISETLKNVERFEHVPRLSSKPSVLEYWEQQKYSKPKLYKLSLVVLALPVTQVAVERTFSGLHFVLGSMRTSLDSDLGEDILFVRINSQFEKFIE